MIKNYIGWKTKKRIVVFESDDWGSFRFKNKEIRDRYIKTYDPKLWMHYNDCFESFEDLKQLDCTLKKFKDKKNNPPSFTFLMNPVNPDFHKIKNDNYNNYYYERFDETLDKRKDGKQIFEWYKSAIHNNLIEVAFHGREHLNVHSWMKDLKNRESVTLDGFANRIWGQGVLEFPKNSSYRYRSTFQISKHDELDYLKSSILDGVDIINKMFNQKTTYFLAPDGPYHLSLNSTLVKSGLKYIGLRKLHKNPLEEKWYQNKYFWLGKKTKEGLRVITRNVIFEPNSPRYKDWLTFALGEVEKAFKYNNPAVICTHRANYVGGLNPDNREHGLELLEKFITALLHKWPNVEFMTSSALGELISNHKNA
jgi:hypothetical protein